MNAQLRAAQYVYDNLSPDEPDAVVQSFHDAYAADPAKRAEAAAWIEGSLNYDGIEADLDDLHGMDASRLIGSDVLARLLRRAKEAHDAIDARLWEMAEDAAERDRNDAAEARGLSREGWA